MNALTFGRAPLRVYWELTRACDLACRHCRAEAQPARATDELTTDECRSTLADLAAAGPPAPHVIFTGGDPLKRPDLLDLVREGVRLGLGVSVAPSATTAFTAVAARALREAGVSAMSLSLDGSTPARHDAIRGVLGCYGWTLAAAAHIVAAGIPMQINTLVTRETERDLEAIAEVVQRLGAVRWSLFFLIPVGRGRVLTPLTAREAERTLGWVARSSGRWAFTVTTTEAPQFRRVTMEYPRSIWAARATLAEAVCLVQTDRAMRALEELQRVRQQFPGTPEATTALNYNTIIYRLYVRPPAPRPGAPR